MSAATAEALDLTLRAIADRNRRTILAAVQDRPRSVGEVATEVALSQQATSHHLRVLRGAGLVSEAREGTRHLYVVRTEGFDVVRQFLEGFWPDRLAALKAAAERAARDHG